MGNEDVPAGQVYALKIINLWLDCIDMSQQARICWLRQEYDHEVNYEYIARLTRLWLELYPKVRGRADLSTLVTEYEKFQVYYREPTLLVDKPEDVVRLEEVLRTALESLKLTTF